MPAATAPLEHWAEDQDLPGEWWAEAHQWRELGFTTPEMLAWWQAADQLPEHARALADLGLGPDAAELLHRLDPTTQPAAAARVPVRRVANDGRTAPRPCPTRSMQPFSRIAGRLPWPVTADIDLDTGRRPNCWPPLALVTCC